MHVPTSKHKLNLPNLTYQNDVRDTVMRDKHNSSGHSNFKDNQSPA
jgi:hypothetical protein